MEALLRLKKKSQLTANNFNHFKDKLSQVKKRNIDREHGRRINMSTPLTQCDWSEETELTISAASREPSV